jgi:hypothetical protein
MHLNPWQSLRAILAGGQDFYGKMQQQEADYVIC